MNVAKMGFLLIVVLAAFQLCNFQESCEYGVMLCSLQARVFMCTAVKLMLHVKKGGRQCERRACVCCPF